MTENEISYKIRGAAFIVHNTLGPGLFESVYESALAYELKAAGLEIKCQQDVPVKYKNLMFEHGFRLDIIVEDKVIIEIKSIEKISDVHKKQLLTYLRLSGKKLGLLINFNCNSLNDKDGIIRVVNNL